MDQTEFALGAVAVRNVKAWDTEVLVLTGSVVFKSAGRDTPPAGQYSESRCIVQ